jgi:hypothetical protein
MSPQGRAPAAQSASLFQPPFNNRHVFVSYPDLTFGQVRLAAVNNFQPIVYLRFYNGNNLTFI